MSNNGTFTVITFTPGKSLLCVLWTYWITNTKVLTITIDPDMLVIIYKIHVQWAGHISKCKADISKRFLCLFNYLNIRQTNNWVIRFNGTSSRLGLPYTVRQGITFIVHAYLHFFVKLLFKRFFFFWHTVLWYQVFLSNTNNLPTVIWYQVFLLNTNNLHTILWY